MVHRPDLAPGHPGSPLLADVDLVEALEQGECGQPVATGLLPPDVFPPDVGSTFREGPRRAGPDVGQPQPADRGRVCALARADGQPLPAGPGHWSPINRNLWRCSPTTEPTAG